MGLGYLLDTNIISEQARAVPNALVMKQFQAVQAECAISSITWHELYFGVERMAQSQRKANLRALLHEMQKDTEILPYTSEAAEWFAQQRASLTAAGLTPSYVDGQIASIAATNNLIMVTRNVKDFHNFTGLTTENWFE